MGIFRPTMSSGSSFFGISEISIKKYTDKADMYDWADLYLDIEVLQKGSEYSRNIKICGSFDKDKDGNITGGSVLRRMYVFFDSIGCKAGINVKGEFEDEEGNKIENIADWLNSSWLNPQMSMESPDYLAYIYKEQPKKAGGKAYTRVYHKLYDNIEANRAKLQDDINWLKVKGVIKEYSESSVTTATQLEGNALSNI